MTLEAGQELLHYRLTEKIGEGGMGVVWRARDTTLNRDVAVKILPHEIAEDPDRLGRFEREARILASLNHPNIAAAYGLHQSPPSIHFIVMELVDGETLADRLERGALPLDETLEVASQVAEALEAAHDRGIIHRDLKPANIKVRPDETLKVLDFGLARVPGTGAAEADAAAATVTTTRAGVILGTAPYMSPEQARGKIVCKRTDIWALGCLLYECLTGNRPFDGETVTDILARIVTAEPDLDALPAETPPFLRQMIGRCLEKDPRRRLRDAGELRVAIETYRSDPGFETVRPGSSAGWIPWAVLAAMVVAVAYIMSTAGTDDVRPPAAVSRWTVPLPPDTRVDLPGPGGKFDYSNTVAVSRDGSLIAFSVIDSANKVLLYVKGAEAAPRPIPGTINARAPFFSPDGQWLGFYRDGKVWKVALRGGSAQELFDIEGRAIAFDAAWSPDGKTILYSDDGIWKASVESGTTERITVPDAARNEIGHHAPRFTADGTSALFTVCGDSGMSLAVMPLDGSTWEIALADASLGVSLGDGRVIFARSGELYAAAVDRHGKHLGGTVVPVLQGVHTSPGLGGMVMTWFDVSDSGTLVYVPADAPRPDERLVWVDHDGTETTITEGPGTWVHPRLSPDGSRISLDIHSADGKRDVYLYELARQQFQQLTHTGVTWESEWSPDGSFLVVLSGMKPGSWSLYRVRTDFSGPPELLRVTDHAVPGSWSGDGTELLYTEWDRGGVYRARVDGSREPELLFDDHRRQGFPRISPNRQWLTYVADEASRRQVFVQSYPAMGATHKVSIDGGREPVWSHDGRRLYYRNDDQMLVVDVTYKTDDIAFGRPRVLFRGEYDAAEVGHQHYDVSHDGNRLLMVRHGEPNGPRELHAVLNWEHEVRELAEGATD